MIGLTFDTDWAPDWIIGEIIDILIERKIPATWFITNNIESLKKLERYPQIFDIGIHPNFLPSSTQGKNIQEVMAHFDSFIPKRTILRTHGLYQTSAMLIELSLKYGITVDSSLYLHLTPQITPHLLRFEQGHSLLRVPFFWEDDAFFYEKTQWKLSEIDCDSDGLKIFNFHPIHIALNSCNIINYQHLKKNFANIGNVTKSDLKPYCNPDRGTKDFFHELLVFIDEHRENITSLSQIAKLQTKRNNVPTS